jgi:hypothetical protein
MSKGSVAQRAAVVSRFLIGLGNRAIQRQLAPFGLTEAERLRGWTLLSRLGCDEGDGAPSTTARLDQLEAWRTLRLKVGGAALKGAFPDAHAHLFRNLRPGTRADAVVTVQLFLERLGQLEEPEAPPSFRAARELLRQRGLDDAALAEARALLEGIQRMEQAAPGDALREADEAAAAALWAWYDPWRVAARAVIRDRNQLLSLGFLRRSQPKASVDEDGEDEVPSDGGA